MAKLQRREPLVLLLLVSVSAVALVVSGCTLGRARQAAELARLSEPLQQWPDPATMRLLIVGDSTAVGTGASAGERSLAGLIARDHPKLRIENRARDGATFADVVAQLGDGGRFDMVLVQAGGNDVIRMRGLAAMRADIDRVAGLARRQADLVVLMPAGKVGHAPFFIAPLSWLMTWRSRQLPAFGHAVAAQHGSLYVNLFHERGSDPFVVRPGLNRRRRAAPQRPRLSRLVRRTDGAGRSGAAIGCGARPVSAECMTGAGPQARGGSVPRARRRWTPPLTPMWTRSRNDQDPNRAGPGTADPGAVPRSLHAAFL